MTARPSQPTTATPRRRRSADERRNQIFAASVGVVARRGYANATLTDIAAEAGIAKGLLWHYFDDHDDLMLQTLQSVLQRIRRVVTDDLDVTGPAPDVVRAVLARTAGLTRTHAVELEAVDQIVHNLRTDDGRQRVTMSDYDATYAEHERLLARGQSEGTIRDADVRVMAVTYQGVIDGMIGYLQAHPDIDTETHAAAVADIFLAGVIRGKRSTAASAGRTA